MKLSIAFVAYLLLISCATTTSFIPYDGTTVEVLFQPPQQKYETLGFVVVETELKMSTLYKKLQEKVALAGGNAVIVQDQTQMKSGSVAVPLATGGFITTSGSKKSIVGTVIKIIR